MKDGVGSTFCDTVGGDNGKRVGGMINISAGISESKFVRLSICNSVCHDIDDRLGVPHPFDWRLVFLLGILWKRS